MKFFETLALASFATAMTTVDSITDPELKMSLDYSIMDGDLTVTMTITPAAGVQNTNMVLGTLNIATDRLATEEEKNQLLALDFSDISSGPAGSGFSFNYMDISGVAPEAPI